MAEILPGESDELVLELCNALDAYEKAYLGSKAALYRRPLSLIRIRVIDPQFAGMKRSRRHDMVWDFLASKVNPDTLQDISVLVLLAPDELRSSLMNLEFEQPTESKL